MAEDADISTEHADRITAIDANFDGTKILQASLDHKISVYNIDATTSGQTLLDRFTAHDAWIRGAKWFDTSIGCMFASIGDDCTLKIWIEDQLQAPHGGRRFRRVFLEHSQRGVPFVSVDTVVTESGLAYVAVIDRLGLLSVYEPEKPGEFEKWILVDRFQVTDTEPSRGDLTAFKVTFDHNLVPLPWLKNVSDEKEQVSLAVTAMNDVKVYCAIKDPELIARVQASIVHEDDDDEQDIANRHVLFVKVLRIASISSQHPQGLLQRDVTWANYNVRGFDQIATISIDGTIRVFELSVEAENDKPFSAQWKSQGQTQAKETRSNLTSALANSSSNSSTTASSSLTKASSRRQAFFSYVYHAELISVHDRAHGEGWTVQWDPSGATMLSTGSDGVLKLWKRTAFQAGHGSNAFALFAEQEAADSDEEDSEEERYNEMIRKVEERKLGPNMTAEKDGDSVRRSPGR